MDEPNLAEVQSFVLASQHVLRGDPNATSLLAEQFGIWTETSDNLRGASLERPKLRCLDRPVRGPALIVPCEKAVWALAAIEGRADILAASGRSVLRFSTVTGDRLAEYLSLIHI